MKRLSWIAAALASTMLSTAALAQTQTATSGSDSTAIAGSISGAGANNTNTVNNNSSSTSGATSSSDTSSFSGSTSSLSDSGNSLSSSNVSDSGNSSSTANAQQSADNAGNSQNITFNNATPERQTIRAAPQVYAPALTTTLTETCMGSTSAGLSVIGWGATGATTWRDGECVRRLNARELAQTIGDKEAARAVLCGNDEVFRAYQAIGRPCPIMPGGKPNPDYRAELAPNYMPGYVPPSGGVDTGAAPPPAQQAAPPPPPPPPEPELRRPRGANDKGDYDKLASLPRGTMAPIPNP